MREPAGSRGTLGALFDASAAISPDAVAVEFASRALTYAELRRAADGLAAQLRARGVGPEDRVAIWVDSPLDFVVAMVAVVRAGGAYVPLDAGQPERRARRIVADSGARVALVASRRSPTVQSWAVEPLVVDSEVRGEPLVGATPLSENLAYVVYTSGSTGLPKGVGVPHRGIVNTLEWSGRFLGVGPGGRCASLLGWAFDAAVHALWEPLTHGATLCLIDEALKRHPVALARWLVERRITSVYTTPALLRPLIEQEREAVACVATWVCGGEAMRWSGFRQTGSRLFNAYGPTENSVTATIAEVAASPADGPPPIGHPIDGVRAYVSDAWPRLTDTTGELVLGGIGVARGYLGAARATASCFVPDPHPDACGGRAYRTGDRVSRDDDGALMFAGRVDEQVKIRGHRVEIGEVEAALRETAGVRDAAVGVRSDDLGAQLVAYLAAEAGGPTDARAARELFAASLPEYMVPARYAFVEALPRLPSGKLDRAALAELDASGAPAASDDSESASSAAAEWSPHERTLCRLYEEVLGVTGVTPADDFIGLGGDSVRVMSLVPQAEAAGLAVAFRDIFGSSIRDIAAGLAAASPPPPEATATDDGARFDMVDDLDEDTLAMLLDDE